MATIIIIIILILTYNRSNQKTVVRDDILSQFSLQLIRKYSFGIPSHWTDIPGFQFVAELERPSLLSRVASFMTSLEPSLLPITYKWLWSHSPQFPRDLQCR